jgi:hypothetical protein
MIPIVILFSIGGIFFMGTIIGYMKLSLSYDRKEITLGMVYGEIKKQFWRYFFSYLLLVVGVIITLGIPAGLLYFLSPVFIPFVIMIGMTYLMIALSIYPYTIGIENAPILKSFQRSFHLIKGKWWRTFGYYILLSILQGLLVYVIMIPVYIIGFYDLFASAISTGTQPDPQHMFNIISIVIPIMMFIQLFFYAFTAIGMGINYFTLVEIKEEVGLREQIEAMNTYIDNE